MTACLKSGATVAAAADKRPLALGAMFAGRL
jgi:hypothetical protein